MSEDAITVAEQFDDMAQEQDAARLGLWVFIGTEILFFGVLFTGYFILRIHYGEAFAEGSRHMDLLLGTIESFALLLSGLTVTLALRRVQNRGSVKTAALLLALTLFLGLVFFGIHWLEYYHDYLQHRVPGLNFQYHGPYARQVEMFYFMNYVMTGFDLLHLTIGLVLLAVIMVMTWRGRFSDEYHAPLELTSLYWNFVGIVWIFMFPLLYLVSRT